MPLRSNDKHVLRMFRVAEGLAASTQVNSSVSACGGFSARLETLVQETHTLLVVNDEGLARKFDRLVGGWVKESVPLECGAGRDCKQTIGFRNTRDAAPERTGLTGVSVGD